METKSILVVEDEEEQRELFKEFLELHGYEVTTAVNGYEALGAVRVTEPDLMILDVILPKENGYRVCRMVKEDQHNRRLQKSFPVLLVTARRLDAHPDRETMFQDFSQADGVLYKPVRLEELLEWVRSLMRGEKVTARHPD